MPSFDPDAVDPESGAPLPVHTTLPFVPPPLTDSSFHRANLWGCTPPGGLPPIPGGGTGPAQQRLLTYIADRYAPADLARSMKYYGECGYRQWWWSLPDSRDNTPLTLQQYCDLTKRTIDAGLIPCHFLRSKDLDGRNPDPTIVYPWIDALLKITGGFTEACHAWEASLFYSPEFLRTTIDSDATRYPNVRWNVHLQEAYASFGPNGHDQGPVFWNANIKVGVKSLLYQMRTTNDAGGPPWSAGMMQARGNDVSTRFKAGGTWGLPEDVRWIPFELVAMFQFNNERDGDGRISDEDTGDLKGYETLCTLGPMPPGGYGNGARMPDGSAI